MDKVDQQPVIPRIIHQTWKNRDVPQRFKEAQSSWRQIHPDWEYRFWTDEELEALVLERAPELVPVFVDYPDNIQRVDAARYVILREFGGLYADLDTICLKPLDDLLDAQMVLPRTTPFGVSNQLMLSVPSHPFFHHAVKSLPGAFSKRRWIWPRHVRILSTTGPLFLTDCLRRYGSIQGLRILTLEEHGHGNPQESYVHHLRGNTWAGWDTHVINFFHDNWKRLVTGAGGLALVALIIRSLLW